MFLKAFILALYAGLAKKWPWPSGLGAPLIAGPVVGLILGDVNKGLVCGATLALAWMGLVWVGAAVPPDKIVGAILGTSFAILTGTGPETALAIGIPASLVGQQLTIFAGTVCTGLMHVADRYAEKGNLKGIMWTNLSGILVYAVAGFVPVFLCLYLGVDFINAFVKAMPEKLVGGLSIASGLLPAVGFAMLLRVIAAKSLIYFVFVGWAMATFLKLDMIPSAVLGLCAGLAYAQLMYKNQAQ